MKTIFLSLLIIISTSAAAISQGLDRSLVTVEWLQKNLNDENLKLFHIGTEEGYLEEHIPGAILIEGREYTFTSEDEAYVYDLPNLDELVNLFESKGVNSGDTIVLYVGTTWVSPMTRLFFTLNFLGHSDNTYILDGGFPLWKENGGAVTNEIPKITSGNFEATAHPDLVTDIDFIKAHAGKDDIQLIDARASVFFEGVQDAMGRKGHIPGAKTLPYTSMVNEGPNGSYMFKTNEELQQLFDAQGLTKDRPVYIYCHIGQQATTVFTAAKMLGYKPVLFDGSMHAWAHDPNNPLEVEK